MVLAPWRAIARVASLFVLSILVIAWRRPDQFASATLWFEEGSQILRSYVDCGVCALWTPVNSSNALTAKLIVLPAFKLSILNAPGLAAIGALLFTAAVVCTIGIAPTHLKFRYLCALLTLVIPTAPENYGIALYSVWWAGLLILLALLWDTARGWHRTRLLLLAIGGLSTPWMIFVAPLFVVRAIITKNRDDRDAAIVACFLTGIAALAISFTPNDPLAGGHMPTLDDGYLIISKFFGLFLTPWSESLFSGALLIGAIGVLLYFSRQKLDLYFMLLLGALGVAIASSLVRVPAADIEPLSSGARYFFYPYIVLGFMLLWLAWAADTAALRAAPLALIIIGIVGGVQRTFYIHPIQPRASWGMSVLDCAGKPGIKSLPLAYGWEIPLAQAECTDLKARSLIPF